jgi:hypothetical protein
MSDFNQASLAAELGCHRSTVARYVKRGMPMTTRAAALQWIAERTSGFGGGWGVGRGPDLQGRATALLTGEGVSADLPGPSDSLVEAYERFRQRFSQLPEVLRGFEGVPHWLRIALPELLDSTAGEVALMVDYSLGTDLIAEDGPRAARLPEPERGEVPAKQWRAEQKRAAAFLEKVDGLLFEEGNNGIL